MAYIYGKVDELDGTALVGSHECVVLVQTYAKAPQAPLWKAGKKVKGDHSISKGTAIATFVNGKYPNSTSGNHAALYLSQDAGGIWVVDQWKGDPNKPRVSKRYLRSKGQSGGKYVDPSNNADAFSVID